jgi:hypothetical protein
MAYTVTNLITDAFYASGIVSREFETVSGPQGQVGLAALNNILTDKAVEKDMIPYYTKYTFNAVAGQETYFIPQLEELDTLVFFLNDVRYQMREVDRIRYKGSPRANNISSLPFNWNLERCLGGANISLYFFPNVNYPMEAWGLFRLNTVALNTDLYNTGPTAQLGTVTIFGTAPDAGVLRAGQLVINGVDLAGTYNTALELTTFINTGVIPNVTATLVANALTLNGSVTGTTITISTLGTTSALDGLTFSNFSLMAGPVTQVFNSMGMDQFYISYLKYALADRLCTEYNFVVPEGVTRQLVQYQRWISKRSGGLDLNMQKISTLTNSNPMNYGQVNIGRGWTI